MIRADGAKTKVCPFMSSESATGKQQPMMCLAYGCMAWVPEDEKPLKKALEREFYPAVNAFASAEDGAGMEPPADGMVFVPHPGKGHRAGWTESEERYQQRVTEAFEASLGYCSRIKG